MSILDLALGGLVVLSVVHATRRGLVREGSIYLGLLAALYVATRYTDRALSLVGAADQEPLVWLGAYVALVAVVLVAVAVATALVQPLTRMPPFWVLDRLGGAAVGLGQGLVLGALALTAAGHFVDWLVIPQLAGSRIAPLALQTLATVLELVPPDVLPG